MKNKRRWTEEEDDLLRQLWKNQPRELTAEQLGRSLPSCTHRVRVLGLQRKKWWTKKEDALLIYNWVERGPEETARMLGRSVPSCKERMYKLTGSMSETKGRETLYQFIRRTGYHAEQVEKAIAATAVLIRGNERGTRKFISSSQQEKVLAWLGENSTSERPDLLLDGKWSRNWGKCRRCLRYKNVKHYAYGLCKSCYNAARRDGTIEEYKKKKRSRKLSQ